MCGIAGYFNVNGGPVPSGLVERMTRALAHRGPDDEGTYLNRHVGLGHRRLSILDLSAAGHQPMTIPGSGCWMVYNGEVYNYIELRRELEPLGHRFQTGTDSEVVLAAFLAWGVEAFRRFNGMWALAIYNEKTGVLTLCRDRYGIKPLYIYERGADFAFASEYKAFHAAAPALAIEVDERAVATALESAAVLEGTDMGLLRHVRNLPPGACLTRSRESCHVQRWWRTEDHLVKVPATIEEQAAAFRELFADACRLRMRADVPVGTSLSGGLDSSSIVAMLAHERLGTHKTFVHTFRQSYLDETDDARTVAASTGTPARFIEPNDADVIRGLEGLLYSFESIYETVPDAAYRVYQAQREDGVIVTLDGHGVDEMMGGYLSAPAMALRDVNPVLHPRRTWELLAVLDGMIAKNDQLSHRRYLATVLARNNALSQAAVDWIRGFMPRRPEGQEFLCGPIEPYAFQRAELPSDWSWLRRNCYWDFHQTSLPRILKNFDLVSMAHGVEVRMPFMDYRLVNFVFSLPDEARLGSRFTKEILRRAMNGILDDRIRLRTRKVGFSSPLPQWIGSTLQPWIEEILHAPAYECGFIERRALQRYNRDVVAKGRCTGKAAARFWKYVIALFFVARFSRQPEMPGLMPLGRTASFQS